MASCLKISDEISLRLQELHDALDDDTETFADLINPGDFNLSDLGQELPPPPPDMLMKTSTHGAKYLSTEELPKEDTESKSKKILLTAKAFM